MGMRAVAIVIGAVRVPMIAIAFIPVIVIVAVAVAVSVSVFVLVLVLVPSAGMRTRVRRPGGVVGACLGLERPARRRDAQAHADEQLRQNVVRLEDEAVGLDVERNVAVAEVVGRLREGERGAARCGVRRRGDDEDRLVERLDRDQRAVLGDEDVAAADDPAARQEDADAPAG